MNAIKMIAAERQRQIDKLGYTPGHDDEFHKLGELSEAGAAYAGVASAMLRGASAEDFSADMMISEGDWPFEEEAWRPSDDPIRNLVKAGALIVAEIERLQFAAPGGQPHERPTREDRHHPHPRGRDDIEPEGRPGRRTRGLRSIEG